MMHFTYEVKLPDKSYLRTAISENSARLGRAQKKSKSMAKGLFA
jgi:hypothetical protein